MGEMSDSVAEKLLDELVWAIDHLAHPDDRTARQARDVLTRSRQHVADWHASRVREAARLQPWIDQAHQSGDPSHL